MAEMQFAKKQLKRLYINKKLTLYQIADIFNCSYRTIHNKLIKYNIPRRKGGYLKYNIKKKKLYELYHKNKLSARKIAKIFNCQEVLIGYYLTKYKIPKKTRSEIMKIHSAKGKDNGQYIHGKTLKNNICACGKKIKHSSKSCYSCNMINRWQNQTYREKTIKKMFVSFDKSPNKIEQFLNILLNKLLPNQYKFVGDGKIFIAGFIPDFINTNGQKKIIEFYGDYWHNDEDSKKRDKLRLKAYKKYGYKTLVIWEHELKNINKVKDKIKEFNNV